MNLRALLDEAGVVPARLSGKGLITSIVQDSRQVEPGSMFVAMPRTVRPSEQFLSAARQSGATVAMVASQEGFAEAERLGMAAILIPDEDWRFHEALWRILDAFHEHPTRGMKVVGITGTNGKTTVAWLVRDMLSALGYRAGYLGTLGFQIPGEEREIANTTPFAVDLYNMLAEARNRGVNALAMEVSSHALAERRADGVEFDATVFTNLTQDHLDFHGSMEAYEDAKFRLFSDLPSQTTKQVVSALHVGNETGRRWAERLQGADRVRYALDATLDEVELSATCELVSLDRIRLSLNSKVSGAQVLEAPLGGGYNVENLLSAVAAIQALGIPLDGVSEWGSQVRPVPGRFEPVVSDSGISVIVDYAHTSDALEKLLAAVKPLASGRVITVFGCGGDRDRTKRPLMAAAAEAGSDRVVLTSDNPRTEDPAAIIRDAWVGLKRPELAEWRIERPDAVRLAVEMAQPGDVVVLAGKGHENYQVIGREKIEMDDRVLAREALERLRQSS